MSSALERIKELEGQAKVAGHNDRVEKDECVYTFDTAFSDNGLFINMTSFLAFNQEHASEYAKRTGNHLFYRVRRTYKPKEKDNRPDATEVVGDGASPSDEPPKKKHASIRVVEESKPEDSYNEISSVVVAPFDDMSASEVLLPSELLPESVQTSIASIVAHNSAQNQDAVKAWVPEPYFESKHAIGLVQLDNGKRIPPTGWSCEYGDGDCDKKENLWLNLSDGMILCGRKNFDGSGGNHHAVMHFETTKYPLAVKLGTITADGKADVYSYDEDDMVLDPLLRHHLAHFGIDIDAMKKTEQTIAEMEVDHNLSFDFSRISEGDKELVPLFGPGYTGLKNIGNTCYLASVIQVLVSIPEFREHFASPDTRPIPSNFDPSQDLCTQSKKLLKWMADGRYSVPEITPETIERSGRASCRERV
eukprot:TRINITY_DN3943_c0_g1_i5.p1 TRINITY_DN3943_c0_g1~~TRINITY_DN3943_c0_g1_i5.p1  ORF type:complete len:419 (-),score=97.25 TRINITY_DN3943_c0_g1_i5:88-1344(-)